MNFILRRFPGVTFCFGLARLLPLLLLLLTLPAAAQTFTTLHTFTIPSGDSSTNSDGGGPQAPLILSGNTLYGTAFYGGTLGGGTVFAVNTSGAGFTALHSFGGLSYMDNTNSDGAEPYAGLVVSGNMLYGTTEVGGTNGNGTVYAVNANNLAFTLLHVFTNTVAGTNSDGAVPYGGLVLSGNTLYGTANEGGGAGVGTVFAVGTQGGFKTLHSFAAATGDLPYYTNTDGAYPQAGLTLSGNTLYGAAYRGGTNATGTIFAINTNGTGFTVLHTFSPLVYDAYSSGVGADVSSNHDGAFPASQLVLSGDTLYGTAVGGGTNGSGTVFSVNTNGTAFTTLHHFDFCYTMNTENGQFQYPENGDGYAPIGGLFVSGNSLYGTTYSGGTNGLGVVYSLNSNGTGFTILHGFSLTPVPEPSVGFTNSDGTTPTAGVILSGNTLYGTAVDGGTNAAGTLFSISLGPVASAPQLAIRISGTNVILTWPAGAAGYALQATTNLDLPASWSPVAGQYAVTNGISGSRRYYRLMQ